MRQNVRGEPPKDIICPVEKKRGLVSTEGYPTTIHTRGKHTHTRPFQKSTSYRDNGAICGRVPAPPLVCEAFATARDFSTNWTRTTSPIPRAATTGDQRSEGGVGKSGFNVPGPLSTLEGIRRRESGALTLLLFPGASPAVFLRAVTFPPPPSGSGRRGWGTI